MGSKGKQLEQSLRARQALAGERETSLYGVAAPGYEEFAATGGISPEEEAATMRYAASSTDPLYSRLRTALQRRQRIQGGYSPGFGASSAKLAREAASERSKAITGARLGLMGEKRIGRLAGLQGTTGLLQGYESEQPQLLGIREALERKRRGVLGTIGAGLGIAQQAGETLMGFG